MGDIFQIFVISRNTEMVIESNYSLGMYVPHTLKTTCQDVNVILYRPLDITFEVYTVNTFYYLSVAILYVIQC